MCPHLFEFFFSRPCLILPTDLLLRLRETLGKSKFHLIVPSQRSPLKPRFKYNAM